MTDFGLSPRVTSKLVATPSGHRANASGPIGASSRLTLQLDVKRGADIVLSIMGLLALAPLFIIIAIAIKLESRGPVFFRQAREGLNGAVFYVFKFRSMRAEQCDASGIAQTAAGDSRVTAIGRFVRAHSIDELPQLINVLTGEMSLVGPRPHVPGMLAGGMRYDVLVPGYYGRHAMRPGITGLAQSNGLRGPTTDAAKAIARVEADLAYIENFSLLLDVKIVLRTLRYEFIGGSAV